MKKNTKLSSKKLKLGIVATTMFLATIAVGKAQHQESLSASLTNVSVTLSNSRLSFRGGLTTGNAAGSSLVFLHTDPDVGEFPSTSSAQLQAGDTVLIGESGSLGTYTVTDTNPDESFSITPVLASGDADDQDSVIATQSSELTVRFTTANAVNDGTIRILVPALASDTASADGIPDGGYFDFGTTAPTVTCPDSLTGYTFAAGTAVASSVTIAGTDYHAFECSYTGAGAIGTVFDGSANDAITIDSLINPAPDPNHTMGTADAHRIIVQHLDENDAVQDSTTVSVGVIEAVKVSATVAPQITFRIIGVASSTSACGVNTSVATTPTAVPLGELSIDNFTNAAQTLAVSTNAVNGYTVTALASDQLGINPGTCTGDSTDPDCIPDSVGDNSAMSHTASDEWNTASVKGFGYSLEDYNTSGLTPVFEYDTAAGNCTGTYCSRQFADSEDSQDPVQIFSSSSVADNHHLYVCYRAIVSPSQAAGEYQNYVTYTATATF